MKKIVAGMTGTEFIAVLNSFNDQYVIVSDQDGADYSSLNAAITGIGAVKIFRIESEITLTANISIPSDVTIVIGHAGSISGAYTLTGDNTKLIFERKDSCIGTTVVFSGTWVAEDVEPENFGAVGDGVLAQDGTVSGTDNQAALNNAIAFAKLTDSKTVRFARSKIYYSDGVAFNISGLKIIGNNATLLKSNNGCFYGGGTVGTYYSLTGNAYEGDSWVKCTNATLLASLAPKDIVKVRSSEVCQPDSGEAVPFGELHMIRSVDAENGIIYFDDSLFWNYLISDSAEVAKITMSSVVIENLNVWSAGTDEVSIAMSIDYSFVDIRNLFSKAYYQSLYIKACYAPYVRMKSFNTDKDGYGYGVFLGNATMYADISCVNIGCRHCVTTGGSSGDGGVTWAARVHDSVGISTKAYGSAAFDSHAACGSIDFDNCQVFSGLKNADVSTILEWTSDATFTEGDYVRSLTHYLYTALGESTDKDPDDIANISYWIASHASNVDTAFKTEAISTHYNNCKSYNCKTGWGTSGTDARHLIITNCEAHNAIYGFNSEVGTKIDTVVFDGFKVINRRQMAAGYAILMQVDCVNLYLNNIHTKNIYFFRTQPSCLMDSIEISNFSALNDTPNSGILINSPASKIRLLNGNFKNVNLVLNTAGSDTPMSMISLNNIQVESPVGNVIRVLSPVPNVIINGLIVLTPVGEDYFVSIEKDVTNLSISNSAYVGANATKLIFTDTDITLAYLLHNCNLFPNMTTFRTGVGALAATVITDGSLGAEGKVTT